MMHRIKMLSTQHGVPDGKIYPIPFLEGEEYEIGPALLESFIDLGAVELPDEAAKSLDHAPSNKMKKAAPENKGNR